MAEYTRFSDLPSIPGFPKTEMIRFEELLGKEVMILDKMKYTGGFGDYMVIKFKYPDDDKEFSTASWSAVIIDKIQKADLEGALPLLGKIEKVKNYYDIN